MLTPQRGCEKQVAAALIGNAIAFLLLEKFGFNLNIDVIADEKAKRRHVKGAAFDMSYRRNVRAALENGLQSYRLGDAVHRKVPDELGAVFSGRPDGTAREPDFWKDGNIEEAAAFQLRFPRTSRKACRFYDGIDRSVLRRTRIELENTVQLCEAARL